MNTDKSTDFLVHMNEIILMLFFVVWHVFHPTPLQYCPFSEFSSCGPASEYLLSVISVM